MCSLRLPLLKLAARVVWKGHVPREIQDPPETGERRRLRWCNASIAGMTADQVLMGFSGHSDWVLAVCMVEDVDGKDLLVTASQDLTVKVFNAATAEKVRLNARFDWAGTMKSNACWLAGRRVHRPHWLSGDNMPQSRSPIDTLWVSGWFCLPLGSSHRDAAQKIRPGDQGG